MLYLGAFGFLDSGGDSTHEPKPRPNPYLTQTLTQILSAVAEHGNLAPILPDAHALDTSLDAVRVKGSGLRGQGRGQG